MCLLVISHWLATTKVCVDRMPHSMAHTFAVFTPTALPPVLADAGSSALLALTAPPPVLTFSSLRRWLLAAVHGASDFHAANAQMAGILQLEPTRNLLTRD